MAITPKDSEKMRKIKVSTFHNISSKTPSTKSLQEVLSPNFLNQQQQNLVFTLRHLKSADPIEYKSVRSKSRILPVFTPSGVFSGRDNAHLSEHSGIVCVDFDRLSVSQVDRIKVKCKRIGYVLSAQKSLGGDGVCVFVSIANPTTAINHSFAYEYIGMRLSDEVGIESSHVDMSANRLNQVRYCSVDDSSHINPSAATIDIPLYVFSQATQSKSKTDYRFKNVDIAKTNSVIDKLKSFKSGYSFSQLLSDNPPPTDKSTSSTTFQICLRVFFYLKSECADVSKDEAFDICNQILLRSKSKYKFKSHSKQVALISSAWDATVSTYKIDSSVQAYRQSLSAQKRSRNTKEKIDWAVDMLQEYKIKPTFVEISRITGVSRQTVSKHLRESK